MTRKPVVAGSFYPGTPQTCQNIIEKFIKNVHKSSRNNIVAGVVPHAGWIFSGQIAFNVFASIKPSQHMTFILPGAVHSSNINNPAIYNDEAWETPMGKIKIDHELSNNILKEAPDLVEENSAAHVREHSIEVQVPFIQYLFPDALIVPLMMPPVKHAVEIGAILGKIALKSIKKKIIIIGSSDLTHYGWNYGFAPYGIGQTGHDWVVKDNDKRIVDLAVKVNPDKIVPEAEKSSNACGAGAIAASVASAKAYGINEGELLDYTTSCDVMPDYGNSSFVGYAGIVF